jgi:hypothetical protein
MTALFIFAALSTTSIDPDDCLGQPAATFPHTRETPTPKNNKMNENISKFRSN